MRLAFTILVGILAYLFVGGVVLAITGKWFGITPESEDWDTCVLVWPVVAFIFMIVGPMHNIARAGYKFVVTVKGLWKNESR